MVVVFDIIDVCVGGGFVGCIVGYVFVGNFYWCVGDF